MRYITNYIVAILKSYFFKQFKTVYSNFLSKTSPKYHNEKNDSTMCKNFQDVAAKIALHDYTPIGGPHTRSS